MYPVERKILGGVDVWIWGEGKRVRGGETKNKERISAIIMKTGG
jgi:hypothetical protein